VLVKTGDSIDGKTLTDLLFGPTLNSTDTIAFIGTFAGGTGIFTQKALLVRSGDTIGGQMLTSFGLPVIDDSGTVAFFGTYPGGEGIFTQSSVITKTGDVLSGRKLIGLGQPAMNRSGEVAFAAQFSDGSSAIVLARPTIVTAPSLSLFKGARCSSSVCLSWGLDLRAFTSADIGNGLPRGQSPWLRWGAPPQERTPVVPSGTKLALGTFHPARVELSDWRGDPSPALQHPLSTRRNLRFPVDMKGQNFGVKLWAVQRALFRDWTRH
jgi:hypothetical protein